MEPPAVDKTPVSTPVLSYGTAPNRWRRRTRRAILLLIVACLIFAGYRGGPAAWRQTQILSLQRHVADFSQSPDMIVYEGDPIAAKQLIGQPGYAAASVYTIGSFPVDDGRGGIVLARNPKGQSSRSNSIAVYRAPDWDRLWSFAIRPTVTIQWFSPGISGNVFIGELRSPSGLRRLVMVECFPRQVYTTANTEHALLTSYTMIPATLLAAPGMPVSMSQTLDLANNFTLRPPMVRIFAGLRDPNDRSHFTIRYQVYGQENTVDGHMDDKGVVTLSVREPAPMSGDGTDRRP